MMDMKLIISLCLAFAPMALIAGERIYTIGNVQYAESELVQWHEQVSSRYVLTAGKPTHYENAGLSIWRGVALQVIDDRHVLLRNPQSTEICALLVTNGTHRISEGIWFEGFVRPVGIYTYTSVLGANTQVPLCVPVPKMSYREFMSALKDGPFPEMIAAEVKKQNAIAEALKTPRSAAVAPKLKQWNAAGAEVRASR
jgi:hypothetical protein